MGSYAPICRIRAVEGNPLTATEILVDTGLGDAFQATPPFTALIWPNQQFPIYGANPYQATNAEEVMVTAVQDDRMTIVRSDVPIPITAGLMFAQIAEQPVVDFGEPVALVDVIEDGVAPYSITFAAPDGTFTTVTDLEDVAWAGSAGDPPLIVSGQYHYAFRDVTGRRSPDQDLFVSFSSV